MNAKLTITALFIVDIFLTCIMSLSQHSEFGENHNLIFYSFLKFAVCRIQSLSFSHIADSDSAAAALVIGCLILSGAYCYLD